MLFSSGREGRIRAWDWRTGRADERLKGGVFPDYPYHYQDWLWSSTLTISADETILAAGYRAGDVLIWDLEPDDFGELIKKHELQGPINGIAWREDGSLFVGADLKLLVSRNPLASESHWERMVGQRGKLTSLCLLPERGGMLTAGMTGKVKTWSREAVDGELAVPRRGIPQDARHHPNWGGGLLMRRIGSEYELFAPPDRSVRGRFRGDPETDSLGGWHSPIPDRSGALITERTKHESGESFAISGWKFPRVKGEGIPDLERKWVRQVGDRQPDRGDCSLDGKWAAVCTNHNLWVLRTEDGGVEKLFPLTGAASDAEFSADGRFLYMTDHNGFLRGWETSGWEEVVNMILFDRRSTTLSISMDGRLIAVGGEDMRVRVFEMESMKEIATMSLEREADDLSILDSGMTLGVYQANKILSFWSIPEEVEIFKIPDYQETKASLLFSTDRKWIAIQGDDLDSGIRLIKGTAD